MISNDVDPVAAAVRRPRVTATIVSAILALSVGLGLTAWSARAATTSPVFSPQGVGAPTTAVTGSGAQLVFWKGANNHLFEAWYISSWNGPVDVSAVYLGGAVLASAPSVAVVNPGTSSEAQIVFWEGAGGHLIEAWWQVNHGWNGPVDWTDANFNNNTPGRPAPPTLTSSPAVAATPNGTQIVFFRSGPANGLFEAWFDGSSWNGPVNVAGSAANLASAPSATVMLNGTQVVCWQGQNGHLEEITGNSSGLGSVTDLTTTDFAGQALLTTAPGVASTANNTQIVFWRATGGDLDEAWLPTTTWNGPVDVTSSYFHGTAKPNSAPAVAVTPGGTQIVFWQSSRSTLEEGWYSGTWNGPAQY